MQAVFDLFESTEAMVYISDMETNELLFMNRRLRESFGCGDMTAYQGKNATTSSREGAAHARSATTRG